MSKSNKISNQHFMENEILSLSALPALTDSIKQAIGFSIWNLYRIQCESVSGAMFLLETPAESFLLRENGEAIKSVNGDFYIKESKIQFEGYVIPSNIKLNAICV